MEILASSGYAISEETASHPVDTGRNLMPMNPIEKQFSVTVRGVKKQIPISDNDETCMLHCGISRRSCVKCGLT